MTRARLKSLVQIVAAVGLLAILASVIGWRDVGQTLMQADPLLVGAALVVTIVGRLATAFQLDRIMAWVGMDVGTIRVLLANSLSALYAMIVPGDLVACVAKWANLSAKTGNRSMVFHAIVYNRLVFFLPWLIFGAAALALHNPWNKPGPPVAAAGLSVAVGVCWWLIYDRRFGPRIDAMVMAAARRTLPAWGHRKLHGLLESLESLRGLSWRAHAAVFALSTLNMAIEVAMFIALAAALGIDVPWCLLIWTQTAVTLLRQIPAAFNGVGLREVTLVAILGRFGVAADAAFSLGILCFAAIALFSLVGGVYQTALLLGLANVRPEQPDATPLPAPSALERPRAAA